MLTAAYAVRASKWPASMIEILLHGCARSSARRDVRPVRAAVGRRVNQTVVGAGPDALDVDVRRRDGVDDAAVPRARRRRDREYTPMFGGTIESVRVRSGLICVQLLPPLIVFQTTFSRRTACADRPVENTSGAVRSVRKSAAATATGVRTDLLDCRRCDDRSA